MGRRAGEGKQTPSSRSQNSNSYNLLYGGLPRSYRRILKVLYESEFPLQACEIAVKAKIKPNSCRVYLRNLLEEGRIVQTGYGYYASKEKFLSQTPSRMGRVKVFGEEAVPRLHNVRLKIEGLKHVVRGSWKVRLGDTEVTFVRCGGGVITVTVGCDRSLDFCEWCFVRDFILRELGIQDKDRFEVVTYEFNNDYEGFRLDGVQALTLTAFDGAFERFYNKEKMLRHEVKAPKGTSLVQLETLLKSGVTSYNVAQTQFAMAQSVRELSESVKGANRLSVERGERLQLLFEGLFKRFDRLVASLESVDKKLDAFTEDSSFRMGRVEQVLVSLVKALQKPKRKRRKRRFKPKPKSRWQKLRKKLRI